jgi:hypothetical protein
MSGDGSHAQDERLSLYWCLIPDHDEDWFIVAYDELDAALAHEEFEGYWDGQTEAEFVCELPPEWKDAVPGWPSPRLLSACGAEYLRDSVLGARIVKIGGKVFVEGHISADTRACRGSRM